jgi:hypothetical protein
VRIEQKPSRHSIPAHSSSGVSVHNVELDLIVSSLDELQTVLIIVVVTTGHRRLHQLKKGRVPSVESSWLKL